VHRGVGHPSTSAIRQMQNERISRGFVNKRRINNLPSTHVVPSVSLRMSGPALAIDAKDAKTAIAL
jgi:hypothetical protein